ncbi:GNAT family N-acetyltransferase [Calothrix sp. 336/3]|uniref:GNAT family N-acetyltransferase n=1 Tax=Calothrix sp. 336/3 TaxID=1337936 RepID=UPI0004E2B487|nr:GNAT family protein [Calothrix sp. 336/3]AKG24219.1 acetyltransferase [Calothrix sp. 336/3]
MPEITIIPCSVEHLESLIAGDDKFFTAFGWRVVDGYLPFPEALAYSLKMLQSSRIWYPWLPYLILNSENSSVIGLVGFKDVPDAEATVEIGYSVAPSFQGQGVATAAASELIKIAALTDEVKCIIAHTLAETSPSIRVLEKCGMTQVSELFDPEDGKLWRWEINLGRDD